MSVPDSEGLAQDSGFLVFTTTYDTLEITPSQIASVVVVMSDQDAGVEVQVDPSLANEFSRITKKAVGEAMVLTLCGQELMRPIIMHEIEGSTFLLSGNTVEGAQAIAARLQSKGCAVPIS